MNIVKLGYKVSNPCVFFRFAESIHGMRGKTRASSRWMNFLREKNVSENRVPCLPSCRKFSSWRVWNVPGRKWPGLTLTLRTGWAANSWEVQLGCGHQSLCAFRTGLSADSLAEPTGRYMLILISKAYESELLASHVGVYAEIPGEVILSIHWGSVPVKVTVKDLIYIWVHL